MSLAFISLLDIRSNENLLNQQLLNSFHLFSVYYKAYYKDDYNDLSFAIVNQGKPVGYVICGTLHNVLTTPDGAIHIEFSDYSSEKDHKNIFTETLNYLQNLAKINGCEKIIVKDALSKSSLSPLGDLLFNQRFESRLSFEMNISFLEGVPSISLRKSYKSLINWGRRELITEFVNKDNLDRKKFSEFQEFHHKVSGKVTRSQETWDTQYHMLQEGLGELILASYKGQLVAGSLFSDYGETSIYFTGVYERDLFDFGISHFILHEGIHRSYLRHQTSKFSLGYFDTDIKDPKWYNIQFFKKGFCKQLTPVIFWSKKVKDG